MFSVIVPVYNAEKYLAETIESVINQSYSLLELILVDDGSVDRSAEICRDYAGYDSRILLVSKRNGGVSSARNEGLKRAKGEWIVFLDSDDTLDIDALKIMSEEITDDVNLVAFGHNTFPVHNGSHMYLNETTVFASYSETIDKFQELYKKCFFNSVWAKCYRKEKINCEFREDIDLGEDLIFNLSFFKSSGAFKIVNKCVYNYRDSNENSLTRKFRPNSFEIQELLKKSVDSLFENCETVKSTSSEVYLNACMAAVQLLFFSDLNQKRKRDIFESTHKNEYLIGELSKSLDLLEPFYKFCGKCIIHDRYTILKLSFNIKKVLKRIIRN